MRLIGSLWGTLFAWTASLSRVFSLELTAYLGFFIHRPFDWHQRCCFEIFNTFLKSLEAQLVSPSFPAYPPHSPSSWKKFGKSNQKQKTLSFSDFEGLHLGNFSNLKTWRKLPPSPTHTPLASVFTQMNALWVIVIVERHSKLGLRRALILPQLVSRENICYVAAFRTEVCIMVKPQILSADA